ncbi:hypothetical protein QBC32DRAFT_90497 [Pseudoneurospora amorphoporcata]|uniref:RBR-type E3 ubiquitin transferase n=1 Tax=Pseudoneurospora amorphoporcata TaxID=241081 RepID=A0AAN6P0E6_9PEZI|nr:hypothetical protein QBC32DRAFT_90497 [Pseudoneurospora amorphoporcata]
MAGFTSLSLSPADLVGAIANSPPELDESEYLHEVFGITTNEAEIEKSLTTKASSLGIDVSNLTDKLGNPNALNATSARRSTLVAAHLCSVDSTTGTETATGTDNDMASNSSAAMPATLTQSTSRKRSNTVNFSQYEKYLTQLEPALHQPKFSNPAAPTRRPSHNIFGFGHFKGVRELRRGLTGRLKRRKTHPALSVVTCICCREEFVQENHLLQTLPCGHTYCQSCLAVMINQSTTDESKMPPRCCTQPIPSSIIKTILTREEQQSFLKAVLQYSTPWESRIFCPNPACGEFIPPRAKLDPKHPFETMCKTCKMRVCLTCKRGAHRLGQDCPEDIEVETVLKMGEKSGWRRCYKCRNLVELTQGCTHMTCRCKAQFCYICGAVWDPMVGCPNFCNGEEELERRRIEEEARLAELEVKKREQEEADAAEERAQQAAERRTRENLEFQALRGRQDQEMSRFVAYEARMRKEMRARQSEKKKALLEKYAELIEKMKERHAKTEQHLEDRQIEAEIELRSTLDASERSIRIQLKYMEAYCKKLSQVGEEMSEKEQQALKDSKMPSREVTQKHLDQLSEQYRIRDGMERRHQAQINVLREKQGKKMEQLLDRHEDEMEALLHKKSEEIEDLAVEFANEADAISHTFAERKAKLQKRWLVSSEILRVEQEKKSGMRYASLALPQWPVAVEGQAETETETETEEEEEEQEIIELEQVSVAESEVKRQKEEQKEEERPADWPLTNNIKTTEIELPLTPKTVTPVVTPTQARFDAELRRYRSRTQMHTVAPGEESPVSPLTVR